MQTMFARTTRSVLGAVAAAALIATALVGCGSDDPAPAPTAPTPTEQPADDTDGADDGSDDADDGSGGTLDQIEDTLGTETMLGIAADQIVKSYGFDGYHLDGTIVVLESGAAHDEDEVLRDCLPASNILDMTVEGEHGLHIAYSDRTIDCADVLED